MKIEYKEKEGRRVIREIVPVSIFKDLEDMWILKAKAIDGEDNEFSLEGIQRIFTSKKQRIPCVTIYVMNSNNEFLLIHHNKLNKWVPVGGKIDQEDTPEEAAMRESFEEVGINVKLVKPSDAPSNITSPFGVQVNPIIEGQIDHVDFIYLAKSDNSEVNLDTREAKKYGWYGLSSILELDTFENVKEWCKYFSSIKN